MWGWCSFQQKPSWIHQILNCLLYLNISKWDLWPNAKWGFQVSDKNISIIISARLVMIWRWINLRLANIMWKWMFQCRWGRQYQWENDTYKRDTISIKIVCNPFFFCRFSLISEKETSWTCIKLGQIPKDVLKYGFPFKRNNRKNGRLG